MVNRRCILDLPDEIFLMIFKELDMVDVLYFVANVNQRWNRLAHDYLYVRHLDLSGLTKIKNRSNEYLSDEQISSEMCEKILPRIHHHVDRLTLEPDFMKYVLANGNYPQLYFLSFRKFHDEVLHQYFTDDANLRRLCKQLTHIHIDFTKAQSTINWEIMANTFATILFLCDQLIELEFDEHICEKMQFISELSFLRTHFLSTTLTKLKITVAFFYDCLYLLDGRLEALSILIINVLQIFDPHLDMDNKKELPKLKYFSFTSCSMTDIFDTLIVPMIRRMINLEQLKLYLELCEAPNNYLDGIRLSDLLLNHLTKLQKFTFKIDTIVFYNINDDLNLITERIQRSFTGEHYRQVVSVVRKRFNNWTSISRIYSLPYDFDYFHDLDNSFLGAPSSFDKVRFLTMTNDCSLEDELFIVISRVMPFLQQLSIKNEYPLKSKRHSSETLVFPHLKSLDLNYAHDDYVELFLLKTKTYLPSFSILRIGNKSLQRLKNKFNDDSTHFNLNQVIIQLD